MREKKITSKINTIRDFCIDFLTKYNKLCFFCFSVQQTVSSSQDILWSWWFPESLIYIPEMNCISCMYCMQSLELNGLLICYVNMFRILCGLVFRFACFICVCFLLFTNYYFRHFNEEYGVFSSMPDGITMTGGRVILLYISELWRNTLELFSYPYY